jgi:hypothetical protein
MLVKLLLKELIHFIYITAFFVPWVSKESWQKIRNNREKESETIPDLTSPECKKSFPFSLFV